MSEFYEYKFYTRDKLHCDKFLYNKKPFEYNVSDPKDRNLALKELKQLIGQSIDFAMKDKSCTDDDEFLLRFLFAREFVIADAFKLLVNYHSFKQKNANLLSKISALDESIQLALRDGFPTIIPQRDRKGRKMLILFAANWNPVAYSLITVYRALLLSLEKLLEDIQNQANGFVLIVDWTNFSYKRKYWGKWMQLQDFYYGQNLEKKTYVFLFFQFRNIQPTAKSHQIDDWMFPSELIRNLFKVPCSSTN